MCCGEATGIVAITVSAQASLINGEVDVYGDIPTIIIVQTIKNDSPVYPIKSLRP